MKKNKKIILLILFTLCLLLPFNKQVQAEDSDYISINETKSFTTSSFDFSNLHFVDNINTSTQSFGVTGILTNNSNNQNYTAQIYYYDSNYNQIGNYGYTKYAQSGTNSFSIMTKLNILNGHNINEIAYYRLFITPLGNFQIEYTPSRENMYKAYPYVIDKYNIDIIVNENNTFDITETITAYFNEPRHGIYRKIPLKNKIERLNGTTSFNRAVISNIQVNSEYQTSKSNGYYQIQIGDSNKTLTGQKTYTIKYTYNIGKDPIKDYDELYYNIIGNEWDTVIGNITFNITMPKKFDSSKIGFSSGTKGSIGNSQIIYNVSGNKITGNYNGILNKNEAITVRCELPEGYFAHAENVVNLIDYLIFIVPLTCLIISFLLWLIFGRDRKTVKTVEFYPPEGFNSLEIGYLYKGKATNEDVTSLLVYLANKGYIKIVENDDQSLFSKMNSFKIVKLKDYDGNNYNERIFLEGLFQNSVINNIISQITGRNQKEDVKDEVTVTELYNKFYLTVNNILKSINTKENKEKIYENKSLTKRKYIIIMIILTYLLITAVPIINYGSSDILPFAILFPAFGFTFLFYVFYSKKTVSFKIFGLIWGLMFGGIPFCTFVLPAVMMDQLYTFAYIIGFICIIGMFIFLNFVPKRTKYGNEILGKIQGFKSFLEIAKKEELEAEVAKNPNYFYDILPYTYVLGVSDKWISRFEEITTEAPNWYSGAAFTVATFGSFMNLAMASANTAMSSHPSDSGSDGSSGGGSSGGGSGGGGGGSW